MPISTTRRCLAVLALSAALALPASTATAKPGFFVVPGGFSLTADLPQSNGYSIYVVSFGHRRIEMVARREGTFAIYLTRGEANRRGLDVDFGRFGRLEVHWSGGQVHKSPRGRGCRGRAGIVGRGVLHGTVRFRGEGGFVDVAADHIKGTFERSFKQVCRIGAEGRSGPAGSH